MSHPLLAQYVNAAHTANQQGLPAKAVEYSQLALALNPGMPEVWFNLGIAQARLGQKPAAIASLEQARLRCLDSAEGQNSIGLHLLELGALEPAETCLRQAVKLAPRYAYAHSNLGKLYRKRKLPAKALAHVTQAIELAPKEPLLHVNLAGVYLDLKQRQQAEEAARKALELAPALTQAWVNLSVALCKQQRLEEAERAARKALELSADLPEAWESLGGALAGQHRFREAETALKKSVALQPASADAWFALGTMYGLLNRHALAEVAYRKSIELDPEKTEALSQLGFTLKDLKRYDEALDCLRKAYQQDPTIDYLLCRKLMLQVSVCDWNNREQEVKELALGLRAGTAMADPLSALALFDDPQLQRIATKCYIPKNNTAPEYSNPAEGDPTLRRRIRIGYFSPDFRDHPVAQLLVELLELHDRSRFEVLGFSFNPKTISPLGQRISHAFDRFFDASEMSDPELTTLAHNCKLDIAIDLSGHTAGSRTKVFAQRIAPAQVNYLGYPGTMGAEYIDYLITDSVVCPPGSEAWYTEKMARLPHCYMPHDSQQAISERTPSRSEFGLPESGFVFCCFNNHQKISPEVFDIWMRLLRQVEGSALWLSDGPELMKNNLRHEATSRGVEPGRLVFAKRVDQMADHLARYRLADLFVDTLPYNAQTTACDALWAGVPVLTRTGLSFSSRVAASLLHAIGLPELVTDSPEAYETLALGLAREPTRLQAIRAKLAEQKLTCPLFDTNTLVRDVEKIYTAMYKRVIDGLPPDNIDIET